MNTSLKIGRNICAAALLGLTVAAGGAAAHDGATGVVKERMDAMKTMGGAMKQLAAMMKGQSPFDAMAATQAGMTIQGQAEGLLKLFPKGSDDMSSRAKPEVWTKWGEFEAATAALNKASAALAGADMGAGKSDIMALFAGVGKSCKGCHEQFRKPKDK
ncbi:MAG: cytochrome c, class II [Hyphomicrobiales bacterium]|nr:MAG: cytochrome c, class II [Hyphomicrobiales bacterium]